MVLWIFAALAIPPLPDASLMTRMPVSQRAAMRARTLIELMMKEMLASLRDPDRLTPEQLVDHLAAFLRAQAHVDAAVVEEALLADYLASGARARPQSLRGRLPAGATPVRLRAQAGLPRQNQHLSVAGGVLLAGADMPSPKVESRR